MIQRGPIWGQPTWFRNSLKNNCFLKFFQYLKDILESLGNALDNPLGAPWGTLGDPWGRLGMPWEALGTPWETLRTPL